MFDFITFTLDEGVDGHYVLQMDRDGVSGQTILSEKQMLAVQSVLSEASGKLVKFEGGSE